MKQSKSNTARIYMFLCVRWNQFLISRMKSVAWNRSAYCWKKTLDSESFYLNIYLAFIRDQFDKKKLTVLFRRRYLLISFLFKELYKSDWILVKIPKCVKLTIIFEAWIFFVVELSKFDMKLNSEIFDFCASAIKARNYTNVEK